MDGAAALLGRYFPNVPANAVLVYCDGRIAVPAAGGSADMEGGGNLGGTGFLYRAGAFDQGRRWRHQLIGVGATLVDYQDTLYAQYAAAGPGSTAVATLLGLSAAAAHPFRHLRISSTVAGAILRDPTGPVGIATVATPGLDLFDGVIPVNAELQVPGAGTWYVACSRAPEDRAFSLSVNPYVARFRSDGSAVDTKRYARSGLVAGIRPTARADGVVEPWPVSGDGWEAATDEDGFGLTVSQVLGGTCPTTAVVHGRMIVAVWPTEA